LGAGIDREGVAMNATGTSDCICPAFDRIILSDELLENNYCCYPHTIKDMYVTIAFNLTGGLLMRWYRDTLCEAERERARQKNIDPYDEIISGATDKIQPLFFLPHFTGAGTPTLDPLSRGALVGLGVSTTKADITKAVLDSTNYEMMYNLEALSKAGIVVNEIRAIGGGAKSKRWLQLKADAFGVKVVALEVSEAASLGAAILGGLARGLYDDAHDAVSAAVRCTDTYHPDEGCHARYQELYKIYRDIYSTLRPLNVRIAQTE
jgi:xylulokinase